MRQFWMALCMATLGLAPACTAYQTDATAPTVSYNYSDDDGYLEVSEKADDYCQENYNANARLVDRSTSTGGYRATFACE